MRGAGRIIIAILAMLAYGALSWVAPDGSLEKATLEVLASIWTATIIILVAVEDRGQ